MSTITTNNRINGANGLDTRSDRHSDTREIDGGYAGRIRRTARRGLVTAAVIASAVGMTGTEALAESVVRVSIKVVTDQFGSRPTYGDYFTDGQIQQAITEANTALQNMGAGWSLELTEIVNANVPQWFNMDCDGIDAFDEEAKANQGVFLWRNDAINIYVVNNIEGCAGACSFPHGIAGSSDVIIINNHVGSVNGGLVWLHEVGHYFGLFHTFQCLENGSPCPNDNIDLCLGAGGVTPDLYIQPCPDVCPHELNIMSYTEGQSPYTAHFTTCQLDVVGQHQASTRQQVMGGSAGGGDPPPPPPGGEASCMGHCGGQAASGCYCDDECANYGDCCLDIQTVCGSGTTPPPEPPAGGDHSCVGNCGGPAAAGCFCDDECMDFGDCCSDHEAACGGGDPNPPPPPTGDDDVHEDNDSPDTATELSSGIYNMVCLDADWFVMSVTATGTIALAVDGDEGDIDLIMFDANLDPENPLAVSAQNGSHEQLEIDVQPGTYYALVLPYQGQGGPYTLTAALPDGGPVPNPPTPTPTPGMDDDFEENDSPNQTITIFASGTFELMGLDEDWFGFDTSTGGTISISISGNEGDLDLLLFDDAVDFNNPLAVSAQEGSNESIEANVGPGVYIFAVLPYQGQTGAYTMTVTLPEDGVTPTPVPPTPVPPTPAPGMDDDFEENDSPNQTITIFASGTFELMGLDEDWFGFDTSTGGTISISISGNEGDLDLVLFDDAVDFENPLAVSAQEGSNEAIEAIVGPGVYIFAVLPYQGQTGAYTMTVTLPQDSGVDPKPNPNPEPDPEPEGGTGGGTTTTTIDVDIEEVNIPISAPCAPGAVGLGLSLMGLAGLVGVGGRRRNRRNRRTI